jgi:hypothetical protein
VVVWQGQEYCLLLSLGDPYLLRMPDPTFAWVPRDVSQAAWDQRVAVRPTLAATIVETWGNWRLAKRADAGATNELCRIHFVGKSGEVVVVDDEWACLPSALAHPEFEKCLWYFLGPLFRRNGERLTVTAAGGGVAANTWSMAFETRDAFRQAARDILQLSLADRAANGATLEIHARMTAP